MEGEQRFLCLEKVDEFTFNVLEASLWGRHFRTQHQRLVDTRVCRICARELQQQHCYYSLIGADESPIRFPFVCRLCLPLDKIASWTRSWSLFGPAADSFESVSRLFVEAVEALDSLQRRIRATVHLARQHVIRGFRNDRQHIFLRGQLDPAEWPLSAPRSGVGGAADDVDMPGGAAEDGVMLQAETDGYETRSDDDAYAATDGYPSEGPSWSPGDVDEDGHQVPPPPEPLEEASR